MLRPEVSAASFSALDLRSSSHGATQRSVGPTSSTSDTSAVAGATGTYDTDTGTDFGLLGSFSQEGSQEEEGGWGREGTPPRGGTPPREGTLPTTVSFTDTSWDQMAKVMPWPAQRSEVGGGGVTEIVLPGDHNEAQQVCSLRCTGGGGRCQV